MVDRVEERFIHGGIILLGLPSLVGALPMRLLVLCLLTGPIFRGRLMMWWQRQPRRQLRIRLIAAHYRLVVCDEILVLHHLILLLCLVDTILGLVIPSRKILGSLVLHVLLVVIYRVITQRRLARDVLRSKPHRVLIHTLLLVGSHSVHYSYTYHLSRVGHHGRLLHGMKICVDRSERLSWLPSGML